MQKPWVRFLGRVDPLEEEMATYSSTLAGKIPMDIGAWQASPWGCKESDRTGQLSTTQQRSYEALTLSLIFSEWSNSSVQSLSHVRLFVTPGTTACQASLSITNCQSLPKPMSIKSVMPSNHLNLCCPLLLLPSIFPSIRVF